MKLHERMQGTVVYHFPPRILAMSALSPQAKLLVGWMITNLDTLTVTPDYERISADLGMDQEAIASAFQSLVDNHLMIGL